MIRDLSHPHSLPLFAVFDFDSYMLQKLFRLLPEPLQDRYTVDEQLKPSGAFFIPQEPGFRVLGFKMPGVFARIEFAGETDGSHIYKVAGHFVRKSERTAIFTCSVLHTGVLSFISFLP